MYRLSCALLALAFSICASPAAAELFARKSTPAGSVITRKVGEEVSFIDLTGWRGVDVNQDLLPGDLLRTNAHGHLAVLFADRTQVRLGRNTTMLIKAIGSAADTLLQLQSGTVWGRAERGGVGLTLETPAASAAIRGTDWTLTVDGDGKTSLIVLEGLVELSNPYGSVSVAQGEAAVASIGQAPTKLVIVDPDDREQMLFYLSLRRSFAWMPASTLSHAGMRAERARIEALPDDARSSEDRVVLAETALVVEGIAGAAETLASARKSALTTGQQARLDLVAALLAGAGQRFGEAAQLFAKAAPRLDPERRAIALYGGYFARALAFPDRVEAPPRLAGSGPRAALAAAWTAGFLENIDAAIDVIADAERRFPHDPTLPAVRAQLALLLDDREQVHEAIERALVLDPEEPTALEARANYRAGIEGDLDGALADLKSAAEISPGTTSIWNAMGIVEMTRGAEREAEAALRRAIALDPHDPVTRANLAILLLDQDRTEEARQEIDQAFASDPSFDVGLVARGRYHLQAGNRTKAVEDLLAASTANPAYSQALLLLATAHFENGDREAGEQALENAERLDPNDPVTSMLATAIAIDGYQSDRAIAEAQKALARSKARGGHFASPRANRDAGSLLNSAFRLQGLDAWGRYYGDVVFDPFAGASLVDQAVAGTVNPFASDLRFGGGPVEPAPGAYAFSSLFQGLMMAPEILSGRSLSTNLLRRPFIEGAIGGGYADNAGEPGWLGTFEVQSFTTTPVPWSLYANIEVSDNDEFRERFAPGTDVPYVGFGYEDRIAKGTAYLTARPTPYDRVVTFLDYRDRRESLLDALVLVDSPFLPFDAIAYDRRLETEAVTGGIGWSHTLGYRNVFNAAVFGAHLDQTSREAADLALLPFIIGTRELAASTAQDTYLAAINHTYGHEDLTWRYGIEGGSLRQRRVEVDTEELIFLPPMTTIESRELDLRFGRAYVDLVHEPRPDLKLEAALFATLLDGALEIQRLEPRFGVAWAPTDGHWLRAGFLRETEAASTLTLAPIGLLGLQAGNPALDIGGYSDTIALRWDAEWHPRIFTTIDYQHQELHGLSIPVPGSIVPIDAADGFDRGRIDRVAATANVHLGAGFGLFGTVAWTDSSNETPGGPAGPLPFVPTYAARTGITYVHPANVKATIAASYVGERVGDAAGTVLDGYWTTDAFLTWEGLDKRFVLELAGYNLFDESFEVATSLPGWGRTFVGTFKVRF